MTTVDIALSESLSALHGTVRNIVTTQEPAVPSAWRTATTGNHRNARLSHPTAHMIEVEMASFCRSF